MERRGAEGISGGQAFDKDYTTQITGQLEPICTWTGKQGPFCLFLLAVIYGIDWIRLWLATLAIGSNND